MTEEQKKLLLNDLSARVPYDTVVKVDCKNESYDEVYLRSVDTFGDKIEVAHYAENIFPIDVIKPYLRPMSSMTDDEEKEYNETLTKLGEFMFEQEERFKPIQLYQSIPFEMYEFFNAHHFDYRGLIEKGLADVAPEGMYIKHGDRPLV